MTQRRPEALESLFVRDAEWTLPGVGTIRGVDEIIRSSREFMAEYPHLIHAVHGSVVDLDVDAARARSYCSERGIHRSGDNVEMWGIYLDQLQRGADGWRFARRDWHWLYRGRTPAVGRFYDMPEAEWP